MTDVRSLMERATGYGCAKPLRSALNWLERCLADKEGGNLFPLAIILCARRPCHLIGSNSTLELCPYIVEVGVPHLFPQGDQTRVRPAGHRHTISALLLRSMSGSDTVEEVPLWVQVGAGSLGSKIALHLARAGRAPHIVIDRGNLSPHNAARHGLVPIQEYMQMSWMSSKALAVAEAIRGLGQIAKPHVEDIVKVARDADCAKRMLPKKNWAVVNSTASLVAREALASTPAGVTIPRVIETSLYAHGRVGLLSIEGPVRNPNTGDLITETYALMREDALLRELVFADEGVALRRQTIGEGCGSATMVMSDAQISMLAAPMAEALAALQLSGLPTGGGRILLGLVDENGISQSWCQHEVEPWMPVAIDGALSWSVRIASRAHRKMADEVASWPTGRDWRDLGRSFLGGGSNVLHRGCLASV